MVKVVKKRPDGYAVIHSDRKQFNRGDIIEADEGAYVVLDYYYVKGGIEYDGWSEVEYLKGKKV